MEVIERDVTERARAILGRLRAELPPLTAGEERQLLTQVCTGLPEAELADAGVQGDGGALEQRLELRLRNLLALQAMKPQHYKVLREQLLHRAYAFEKNHARAEDLVQESFLAMITHRNQYRGDSTYCTWVHSILFRRVMKHRRDGDRRPEISLAAVADIEPDLSCESRVLEFVIEQKVGQPSPEEQHVRRQQMALLLQLIPAILTDKYSLQAFNLCVLQELDYEEAAPVMGISKEYLYRIVCLMRKKLQASERIKAILEEGHEQRNPEQRNPNGHPTAQHQDHL